MANILGRLTINNTELLEVDGDPSIAPGTPGVQGSLAFATISGEGRFFSKFGTLNTDWKEVVVKNTSNFFPVPKNYLFNMAPDYVDSSSIVVQHGECSDSTNTIVIRTTVDLPLSLNVSGAGGLDTGVKQANKWYYAWVISDDSGSVINTLFSLSRTSPTMPNSYTKKRVLRAAFRTDASGNIIPYTIGPGWPHHPVFYFDSDFDGLLIETTNVLHGANSVSFVDVNCSNFIPPFSSRGVFYAYIGKGDRDVFLRPKGSISNGIKIRSAANDDVFPEIFLNTDGNQILQYKTSTTNTQLHLAVRGFVVTQEH